AARSSRLRSLSAKGGPIGKAISSTASDDYDRLFSSDFANAKDPARMETWKDYRRAVQKSDDGGNRNRHSFPGGSGLGCPGAWGSGALRHGGVFCGALGWSGSFLSGLGAVFG